MNTLNQKQFNVPVPDNVQVRKAGGKGHLEGDPSESATGMVRTERLIPLMEHRRRGADAQPSSEKTIAGIRSDIQKGKGINNPIMVAYDHENKWGVIGEGHHRLEAAMAEGVSHVPVTVYRQPRLGERKENFLGGHLAMTTNFTDKGSHDERMGKEYVPTNMHPAHFKQFM
jgi:hypothetical protein